MCQCEYADYGGSKHSLKLRCAKIGELDLAKEEGRAGLDGIQSHLDKIADRLTARIREASERSLTNLRFVFVLTATCSCRS